MPSIRLVIEYDGNAFHGWQDQPHVRTVEGELKRVLAVVLGETPRKVRSAGRTDAGVHARGQVVGFEVDHAPDLAALRLAVSGILRGELAVLQAEVVADNFQPIRDARRKQYSYRIINRPEPLVLDAGRAWHVIAHLDEQRLSEEAALLVGVHDFTSFRAAGCTARTATREIFESEITREGTVLVYRVVGTGFLRYMVRTIIGTLVDLCRNKLDAPSMLEIMQARNRRTAGVTAPAQGLYLDWVDYGESKGM